MQTRDIRIGADRVWSIHGESLPDVRHWLQVTPSRWRSSLSTCTTPSLSWDLNTSWDKALELAKTGWSEGAIALDDKMHVLPPRALDSDAKWRYDAAGERPDIGRFLSGDPACMMRHGHPKGHKPVITLVIDVAAVGMVTAQQMANFGAAVVAAVDKIESAGRRCAVLVSMASRADRELIVPTWVIKNPEDPVDLAALAYAIGHPAAWRRLGFAIYERSPFSEGDWYGYGKACATEVDHLIDPSPNTLIVSGLQLFPGRCKDMNDAVKFAAERINDAAKEKLVETN